jgi:hypothetical protein
MRADERRIDFIRAIAAYLTTAIEDKTLALGVGSKDSIAWGRAYQLAGVSGPVKPETMEAQVTRLLDERPLLVGAVFRELDKRVAAEIEREVYEARTALAILHELRECVRKVDPVFAERIVPVQTERLLGLAAPACAAGGLTR